MLKKAIKFGLATAMALLVAANGWAQRGGHGSAAMRGHVVARPPAQVAHIGTPLSPSFAPIRGVPGFGFDYRYLAAVGQPVRAATIHEQHPRRGAVTPIFWGSAPYYYVDTTTAFDSSAYAPNYSPDTQPQPAQPIVIQLQNPPAQPAVAAPEVSGNAAAETDPVTELAQLVLVRRDGQMLQAVAFTVTGDQLTYITASGARRSFPLSELDKDATRQVNDENGTIVTLPN